MGPATSGPRGGGVYSPPFPMWLLYLIAVVLGGGSLLVQIFAGGDHDDPDHGSSGARAIRTGPGSSPRGP